MADPVAGERTWRIYLGTPWPTGISRQGSGEVRGPVTDEWVEVVELSRLRAAEEERDETSEREQRLVMERARLATALKWLVDLKDGLRNAAYEEQKLRAWSLAREALASLEGGNE